MRENIIYKNIYVKLNFQALRDSQVNFKRAQRLQSIALGNAKGKNKIYTHLLMIGIERRFLFTRLEKAQAGFATQ